MKTIKYLLYAITAGFVFAGCTDDITRLASEMEDPNCAGVYFPAQDNAAELELDPSDPTALTFTAHRTNSEGEITVPIVLTSADQEIFVASDLEFADGQEVSSFTITFTGAEIGKTYAASVLITDAKYASLYGVKAVGFDFSITRVKWNQVKGANNEEFGSWTEVMLNPLFSTLLFKGSCRVFERDDQPGCYRFENPYNKQLVDGMFEGSGYYEAWAWPANIIVEAGDPEKVYIPVQEIGLQVNKGTTNPEATDYGTIRIGSDVKENFEGSEEAYGKIKDGVFTFPAASMLLSMANFQEGKFGFTNAVPMILTLPGAKISNYSLSISSSEPVGGKVTIRAQLGADVTKVKYAFFPGSLNAAIASENASAMDKGDIASQEITKSGNIVAEFEKTGMYTIVANVYNTAGKMESFAFNSFGYIKAGETKPVVLTYGADVTNESAGLGFTTENSIRIYANGQEVVAGYYGVFESSKIAAGTDLAAFVKKSGKAFDDDDLAAINSTKGFAKMVGNLISGTEYTFIVWASNGYVSKAFSVKATTEGKPHPLKISYAFEDLLNAQYSKAQLSKSWNYYAVDNSTKPVTGLRTKLGTVTIADNTIDDVTGSVDPAEDIDYMDISGLSGNLGTAFTSGSDKMKIEYYNGIFYTLAKQYLGVVLNQGTDLYVYNLMLDEAGKSVYASNYALIGGVVADGYMAFVGNPEYIDNQDITFNGMQFAAFKTPEFNFDDYAGGFKSVKYMMLADQTIDAANPMPKSAEVAAARPELEQLSKLAVAPKNFVEKQGRERMHALIDELMSQPKSARNMAEKMLPVSMPKFGVVNARTSFTPGIAPVTGEYTSIMRTLRITGNVAVK